MIYQKKLREGSKARAGWADFVALSEAVGIQTRRGA